MESDLDELTEVFERELQCTPELSRKTVTQYAVEWAVADLDALTDVVERELQTTITPSRNAGAPGSSMSTELWIESELL